MKIAIPIGEWSEKEWQHVAIGTKADPGLARMFGYLCYHTLRSKGSVAGWPDWACVGRRLILIELKTESKTSKCSPAQVEWITALHVADSEVYVARPRNFDALAWVLQQRTRPRAGEHPHIDELLRELEKEMTR